MRTSINATIIFQNAERFHHAGSFLNESISPDLVAVSFTNQAIALECYYKTLYFLIFNKVPHTHNIHKEIYLLLPDDIRKKIYRKFNELMIRAKIKN